ASLPNPPRAGSPTMQNTKHLKPLSSLRLLLAAAVAMAALSASAPAQTNVSGDIASNTLWTAAGSPYTLNSGDVNVLAGVTLTIEPGVTVRGIANSELRILGDLQAIGTAGNEILFTSTA